MPSTQNRETDLAACIDVGVEACPPFVRSTSLDFGGFAGVFGPEIDSEFEEAVFVRCGMRADDQCFHMTYVFLLASDRNGCLLISRQSG